MLDVAAKSNEMSRAARMLVLDIIVLLGVVVIWTMATLT
jgi:hypothetical protein